MSSGPRSSAGGGGGGPPRSGHQQSPDRTLYVGNLPYDCAVPEVEQLVASVVGEGQVVRVHLPMDADGRKRGFGFVTMACSEAAKNAAEQLKSADLRGRRLVVNIAHPKGERPAGGGYAGGGGGGFAGGGGGGGGGGGYQPANFGPPPSRRTFDSDRRRSKHGGTGGEGTEGGPPKRKGGGRGRRDQSNEDFDWRSADKDDE